MKVLVLLATFHLSLSLLTAQAILDLESLKNDQEIGGIGIQPFTPSISTPNPSLLLPASDTFGYRDHRLIADPSWLYEPMPGDFLQPFYEVSAFRNLAPRLDVQFSFFYSKSDRTGFLSPSNGLEGLLGLMKSKPSKPLENQPK